MSETLKRPEEKKTYHFCHIEPVPWYVLVFTNCQVIDL